MVMRLRTLVVLLAISMVGLFTAGCAGSTASNLPSAPRIVVPPASQTVTSGQTASFSVTATGAAPLSYQWNKNGAAISGATSATYTTPATTSSDNGAQFVVVVSNVAGNVTSNAATLTVNTTSTMPQFGHVFIVIGENSAYSSTYNSSNMPYLTSSPISTGSPPNIRPIPILRSATTRSSRRDKSLPITTARPLRACPAPPTTLPWRWRRRARPGKTTSRRVTAAGP